MYACGGSGSGANTGAVAPPVPSPHLSGPPVVLYISPNGSNSNPGTQSRPLLTFAQADLQATPGSVIHVLPGTYSADIKIQNGGIQGQPVIWQSDTPWGAHIVGQGGSTAAVCINGPFITFQGFDVTSSSNAQSGIEGNCSQVPNHDVHIVGNHPHDLGNSNSCPTGGAIESETGAAQYASTNQYIEGNFVEDIGQNGGLGGTCRLFHGIYPATPNTVVRNNVVTTVSAYCLHLFHNPSNSLIVNNTVAHCGAGAFLAGSDTTTVTGLSVSNNIFAKTGVGISTNQGGMGDGNAYSNNLFWSNTSDLAMGPGQSVSNSLSGKSPNFVNDVQNSQRDFHLQAGSPAIDAGTAQDAPSTDYDGFSRPFGCCIDIGAYEWHP